MSDDLSVELVEILQVYDCYARLGEREQMVLDQRRSARAARPGERLAVAPSLVTVGRLNRLRGDERQAGVDGRPGYAETEHAHQREAGEDAALRRMRALPAMPATVQAAMAMAMMIAASVACGMR